MKHYSHRILSPFLGKIIVTFLIVIMSIGICRAQYAGLKIHYLGANHSLVQVQEPQKYLLLPVEEAAPEATVNVLVNNKADQSFQVRLAVNRIDYLVPFALEQYNGNFRHSYRQQPYQCTRCHGRCLLERPETFRYV